MYGEESMEEAVSGRRKKKPPVLGGNRGRLAELPVFLDVSFDDGFVA